MKTLDLTKEVLISCGDGFGKEYVIINEDSDGSINIKILRH